MTSRNRKLDLLILRGFVVLWVLVFCTIGFGAIHYCGLEGRLVGGVYEYQSALDHSGFALRLVYYVVGPIFWLIPSRYAGVAGGLLLLIPVAIVPNRILPKWFLIATAFWASLSVAVLSGFMYDLNTAFVNLFGHETLKPENTEGQILASLDPFRAMIYELPLNWVIHGGTYSVLIPYCLVLTAPIAVVVAWALYRFESAMQQ